MHNLEIPAWKTSVEYTKETFSVRIVLYVFVLSENAVHMHVRVVAAGYCMFLNINAFSLIKSYVRHYKGHNLYTVKAFRFLRIDFENERP
jgi:hypothetical protein